MKNHLLRQKCFESCIIWFLDNFYCRKLQNSKQITFNKDNQVHKKSRNFFLENKEKNIKCVENGRDLIEWHDRQTNEEETDKDGFYIIN
jgi:hypothetical protein